MWYEKSIIYQIYPLGFCGAPYDNDASIQHRLNKISDWIPHMKKLGIDTLYLGPVFDSDSHGYDVRDYRKIDCRLGDENSFAGLCGRLRGSGIKIILDGVFNHVGRGFWAFQDVLKEKYDSKYRDWFIINFFGNSNYNDGLWYEGWEGHFELVKLNLKNPEVVRHILDCVGDWIKNFDIDGLRLDVAYSLDKDFIRELHSFVKGIKPDFFLLGECLHGDYNRFVAPGLLDSCTNYECYKGLYSSFNELNMYEIAYSLNRQFGPEAWALYKGKHLAAFVDNHDVSRIASLLREPKHLSALYGLLFAMPGIPCIYYGSEWGINGKKEQGDNALRPCPEKPTENSLTEYISKLCSMYKCQDVLAYGDYRQLALTNRQLAFRRGLGDASVIVAINADGASYTLRLNIHGNAYDMLTGEKINLDGDIVLPPYSFFCWSMGFRIDPAEAPAQNPEPAASHTDIQKTEEPIMEPVEEPDLNSFVAPVELILAKYEDKEILRNLLEKYNYEFSQYDKRDISDLGLYGYKYLDYYWTEEKRWAFFIKVQGKLAGFAMVNNFPEAPETETDYSLAEFFVMYKYRRMGVGRLAAISLFDQFKGRWQLSYHPKNIVSARFWNAVAGDYTNGDYKHIEACPGTGYSDGTPGDVIIFNS